MDRWSLASTMAEVVRKAVNDDLDDEPDAEQVLAATFGAARDADGPPRNTRQRG